MKESSEEYFNMPATGLRFVMFDTHPKGKAEHLTGILMKPPGKEGGWVAARIYSRFDPKNGKVLYTARDFEGVTIMPSSHNLEEFKKNVKAHVREMIKIYDTYYAQKKEFERRMRKTEQISSPEINRRQKELSEIRERSTGREQEREIER